MPANTVMLKRATESIPHDEPKPGSAIYKLIKTIRSLHPNHWFDGLLDDIKIDLEDFEPER